MTPQIPIEQLVDEVYDTAPPTVKNQILSRLVGQIYEAAPAVERKRLINHLMKPLGILSLMAIANGTFAKIRFQGGLGGFPASLDDAPGVQPSDVVALANFAQQVSTQAIDGLAHMMVASPLMASSVAAALLVKIVMRRRRRA